MITKYKYYFNCPIFGHDRHYGEKLFELENSASSAVTNIENIFTLHETLG